LRQRVEIRALGVDAFMRDNQIPELEYLVDLVAQTDPEGRLVVHHVNRLRMQFLADQLAQRAALLDIVGRDAEGRLQSHARVFWVGRDRQLRNPRFCVKGCGGDRHA